MTAWRGPWTGSGAFRRQVYPTCGDPERKELEEQIPRPHFSPVLQISSHWMDPTRNYVSLLPIDADLRVQHSRTQVRGDRDLGQLRGEQGGGANRRYTFTNALKVYNPIRNYELSEQKAGSNYLHN